MDYQTVLQKVIDVTVEQLDVSRDQVTKNTKFIDDLGADSLDLAEMEMEFEDTFGIELGGYEDNSHPYQTVESTARYVLQVLQEKEKNDTRSGRG